MAKNKFYKTKEDYNKYLDKLDKYSEEGKYEEVFLKFTSFRSRN